MREVRERPTAGVAVGENAHERLGHIPYGIRLCRAGDQPDGVQGIGDEMRVDLKAQRLHLRLQALAVALLLFRRQGSDLVHHAVEALREVCQLLDPGAGNAHRVVAASRLVHAAHHGANGMRDSRCENPRVQEEQDGQHRKGGIDVPLVGCNPPRDR